MFLQRKIDRAVKWFREQQDHGNDREESPLPPAKEKPELGPRDMFLLIFSGMITILPVVMGILALLCLAVYLLFLR